MELDDRLGVDKESNAVIDSADSNAAKRSVLRKRRPAYAQCTARDSNGVDDLTSDSRQRQKLKASMVIRSHLIEQSAMIWKSVTIVVRECR